MCHKGQGNRIIEINYKLQQYKRKARERLISEKGIYHRGKRCIEPEAVFGQIKYNSQWSRFRLRGLQKVKIEFTLVAIAHNLRKVPGKLRLSLFLFKIREVGVKKQASINLPTRKIINSQVRAVA